MTTKNPISLYVIQKSSSVKNSVGKSNIFNNIFDLTNATPGPVMSTSEIAELVNQLKNRKSVRDGNLSQDILICIDS